MNRNQIEWESVEWIQLAQDSEYYSALVNILSIASSGYTNVKGIY
jgi:hypothetical protein